MSDAQNLEPRFIWMDLEMTGLDPRRDLIIEIAAVVTDPNLTTLAEVERVVSCSEEALATMSARVFRMHESNGLIADCKSQGLDIRSAEKEVLAEISRVCPPGDGILCGASIQQDWAFIQQHLPRLAQHLHFRHVQFDVAPFRMLMDAWVPGNGYERPDTDHRAMTDVKLNIEEMRRYQDFFQKAAAHAGSPS